jgi:hypothetical protein
MIKEFFTDPFGLKRIAALQSEIRLLRRANHANCEYVEELREEVGELRKVIRDRQQERKQIAKGAAAIHMLTKCRGELPVNTQTRIDGILNG